MLLYKICINKINIFVYFIKKNNKPWEAHYLSNICKNMYLHDVLSKQKWTNYSQHLLDLAFQGRELECSYLQLEFSLKVFCVFSYSRKSFTNQKKFQHQQLPSLTDVQMSILVRAVFTSDKGLAWNDATISVHSWDYTKSMYLFQIHLFKITRTCVQWIHAVEQELGIF